MKCPVCVEELKMTDRQGVEIDYCPKCRGVWLDRGELDKIIERSTAAVESRPKEDEGYRPFGWRDEPREYDPQHKDKRRYSEDEYKRRKKRSFLEDIFDFD
ncbi:MAG TPA: zf-TFIIB domain-containing protein [Blastocatellia bacterium]|jgi:Zn-finger nucleic acid-binding protein